MNGSSIKYLLKEGLRNTWVNRLMSFASVGVLTTCLMLVGFAYLLTVNLDGMIGVIEQQSTIEVYLMDSATDEQTEQLMSDIEKLEYVESVKYISKQQALEDYAERLGNKDLLNSLENDNILPASLRISISDLEQMDSVISTVKSSSIYEGHNEPTNVADTIINLRSTITWFGVVVVIALVVVSLVIISNTIRASVFARRKEIGIMKQVGATNNFIRIPFIAEGVFLGLLAALVSFVLIWIGYVGVVNVLTANASAFLQSMFASIIPFPSLAWELLLAFALAGSCTGALGSLISLRAHLNV